MNTTPRRGSKVSGTIRTTVVRPDLDWDLSVREAFFDACLKQGIRAKLASDALLETFDRRSVNSLQAVADDASRRAALGWLTIETCLEQFGELAALAFERCVEEAAVEALSQRGLGPISQLRPLTAEIVLRHRDDATWSIVTRARARLSRFWAQNGFCAA